MFNSEFKLVVYQNITPLHIGCGQDVGIVDNPVVRERSTGYPFIPGSGIRGVIRSCFENARDENSHKDLFNTLFGPEIKPGESAEYAGCLSVVDAKLLFFPVRSNKNVFQWITCPFVLKRFYRDVSAFGTNIKTGCLPENLRVDQDCYICSGPVEDRLTLEEFPFKKQWRTPECFSQDGNGVEDETGKISNALNDLANMVKLDDLERILIVSDRTFGYFVEHATIIMQRNRLTSAKTVAEGALFSVESIPPEAVFYGFIGGSKARKEGSDIDDGKKALEHLFNVLKTSSDKESYIQLGGDESTGLGITRMNWI